VVELRGKRRPGLAHVDRKRLFWLLVLIFFFFANLTLVVWLLMR
jgi:hypothetical protein